MSRTARLLALLALVTGLSTPAATARVADPATPPLSPDTTVSTVTWDIDTVGHAYGVGVPRGWTLAVAPDGTGRFTDPTGTLVETLGAAAGERTPRADVRRRVGRLDGVDGVRVLTSGTEGPIASWRSATITYRTVDAQGHRRFVLERYVAYRSDERRPSEFVLTLSGRMVDRPGLLALADRAVAKIPLVG